MTSSILTQQQLIVRLREELDLHVSSTRVHAWIREGMPTAPKGGARKPRFIWELTLGWLLQGAAPVTPIRQEVRNRLFLASIGKGA